MTTQSTKPPTKVKRATAGFAISLAAGILNFFLGFVFLAWSITYHPQGWWGQLFAPESYVPSWLAGVKPSTLGAIAIVWGIIIIIGAILIYMPGKETIGGILVIAFSATYLILFPVTYIFAFIGIFGGALGLAKKSFSNL